MRIVILNWRDIRNPQSGGAEILTHEIAKYAVKKGHKVIQFSSLFPGGKTKEVIDKVTIIRRGRPDLRAGFASVHFQAYKYYKKKGFGDIDAVVDEIHGVPFFTPLYVKEKKVALICEKAGNLWKYVLPFPLDFFGRLFEELYPKLYRKIPVITISNSSKEELSTLFAKKNIQVIFPGSSSGVVGKIPKKGKILSLVFVSRLSKTKGVEDAICAVEYIKKAGENVALSIIGTGEKEYIEKLKGIVQKKNLHKHITFCGFVSEKEKERIIDGSHFLIATSQKEGWGLTVHEAGSRGVPAIVYNVPGLSEVVVKGVNGVIVDNTPEKMAKVCIDTFKNAKLYKSLQLGAISERKKYTWDKTAEDFLKLLET